jgi:Ca2+-binding EF-hand superfamily protein
MKRIYLAAAAGLAVAAAGAAVAQRGPGAPARDGYGLFQFDANADGKLTRAEFDAAQKARFADLDANKDGTATREEIKAHMNAQRAKMEKARFVAMDTDKNGQLSEAELAAAREKREDGPRGFGHGGKGGKHRANWDGPRGDKADKADKADAGLTFQAFSKRGVAAFNRADVNKDGTVTIAELQTQASAPR